MNQHAFTYLVAGGDQRQVHLANLLAAEHRVYALGFSDEVVFSERVNRIKDVLELPMSIDIAILPVPALTGVRAITTPLYSSVLLPEQILKQMTPNGILLGGMISPALAELSTQYGVRCIDYMEREELAVLNAVPTAEGAIQIAMQELPTTLFGQRCLITGFGRIGKVLARDLLALGMRVTVAARKHADLAWITVYGAKKLPMPEIGNHLEEYDLIINTVPAKLFTRDLLSRIRKDSLVIDLASKPGGVDFDAARELGVNTIWALSLPGKVAPISAGQIICNTIDNILSETLS